MIEKIDALQQKLNADLFNILKTSLCLGVIAWLYYLAAYEVSFMSVASDCINNGQVEQLIDGKKRVIACAAYEKSKSTLTETFEKVTNDKY
ncbi:MULTISPECIES: hypothetical protein [unclassified Pseudoalteromonas]|uniref:hypothetical protein n=1 Tax=unclassified Pseudoalteromonas TaxID=194690 RepID=UPI00386DDB0F